MISDWINPAQNAFKMHVMIKQREGFDLHEIIYYESTRTKIPKQVLYNLFNGSLSTRSISCMEEFFLCRICKVRKRVFTIETRQPGRIRQYRRYCRTCLNEGRTKGE